MRGRHGQFPEYHTSADNLDFVSGERMAESLDVLESIVDVVDRNRTLRNLEPYGEPSSAAAGSTARWAAQTSPTSSSRCCGCSTSPTAATTCSTSPSVRASPSTPSPTAADLLEEHDLVEDVPSGR